MTTIRPSTKQFPNLGNWLVLVILLIPTAILITQLQSELMDTNTWRTWILGPMIRGGENPILDGRPLSTWILRAMITCGLGSDTSVLVLAFAATYSSLLLTALLTHRLLDSRSPDTVTPLLAAALLALALPWGFLSLGYSVTYPYDLPAVALTCGVVYSSLLGRVYVVVPLFVLAVLNKESSVWLLPGIAIALSQSGSQCTATLRKAIPILLWMAGLALLYLVTVASVRWWIVGPQRAARMASLLLNPGDPNSPTRLSANILELTFGHRGGLAQNVWWPLVIHLPALLGWKRLPAVLRGFYLGAPILISGLLVAGNIWELRLFADVAPLGAVGIAVLLAQPRLQAQPQSAPNQAQTGHCHENSENN